MKSRDRGRPKRAASAILVALVTLAVPARLMAAQQTLLLEVVVNGYATGKIGEFVSRDGVLFARPIELNELGFRIAEGAASTQDGLIAVAALPGIDSRIDQTTQTLYVTATPDRLLPTLLRADGADMTPGQIQSGTGVTLDYDIAAVSADYPSRTSGTFDVRAFSPWGVASSGVLAYAGAIHGLNPAVRLDSDYVYSDPDQLRRYRLGDFINGGLGWSRQVRLGGVQINSDFSMRPDLVTFPLPSIGGAVAAPSTIDVLVNGAQLLSRQVQPGPFEIDKLPVITGAGSVDMTVTDALGNQVTTSLPFYASGNLLAPGLDSYSVEVGKIRRNWGVVSDDYGNLAESVTYRLGLTSVVTIEGHAEATRSEAMGGGGVVVNVGNLAVMNFAMAGSAAAGSLGTQFSAGAQRIGRAFSFGAAATLSTHSFRDVVAMNGDPAPRRRISAYAGVPLGGFGSLGIAYTAIDRDAASAPIRFIAAPGDFLAQGSSTTAGKISIANGVVSLQPARRAHLLSASYTAQIGDVTLFVTGFRDFASRDDPGVMFGLSVPLGDRSSASANAGADANGFSGQIGAQQSAVRIGDWGYQTYVTKGVLDHEFAQLDYKTPWSLLSAGADEIDRRKTLRAEAQGAVSFADGGLFLSNTIQDSFAIVDTDGAPGIRVLNENREVDRTDSAGRLLVPDLRSFDLNHLAIDPVDVPVDATAATTEAAVRPQDRSGVVVHFPVRMSHGALLRLVDDMGGPIPVGSSATVSATGAAAPVGYGGEAFLQDLSPGRNRVVIERPNGRRCVAEFDYQITPGDIPTIGPASCHEKGQ